MLHILSIVVLADNNVLTWYESNLRFKSKYVYFPIIQSDNFFRERLLKALSISVSIADRYSLIGKKNILYVGRLVEIKNVSLLLRPIGLL